MKLDHASCIILLWGNLNWNRCIYHGDESQKGFYKRRRITFFWELTQFEKTLNKANETLNEATLTCSFKKYWLKLCSPTETRFFATEQNKRDFTVRHYLQHLQSRHTESQKDSHRTLQETSFNSKLSLKISFTNQRLSPTGKKNLSRAFLVRAKIPSISQQSQNQQSS